MPSWLSDWEVGYVRLRMLIFQAEKSSVAGGKIAVLHYKSKAYKGFDGKGLVLDNYAMSWIDIEANKGEKGS